MRDYEGGLDITQLRLRQLYQRLTQVDVLERSVIHLKARQSTGDRLSGAWSVSCG